MLFRCIEDYLSFDCRDMQVEAAVYEVRPYNFIDKRGNLARLWSCKKVTLSSQLYLSYIPSFVLSNVKHKKQHSTIYAVKNDTPIPLVLPTVNAESIMRMELHVYSCYFNPLTVVKVAVRLLCSVDQPKHDLAAFT